MAGGQLVFQPPKFDWHTEDQQQAFDEWKGQITLVLHASSIQKRHLVCNNNWISQLRKGLKDGILYPSQQMREAQKDPERVFKAIADTLEVSMSYWNHIDKIYSNIKQGDNESTDQLDQKNQEPCRKMPVLSRCETGT